jgi:hypothetical protein
MNRPTTLAVATAIATTLLAVVAGPAQATTPAIQIVRIHYAQTGTNLDTEYIVLKNTSSRSRSITGWRIISAPSTDNQYYVFPGTRIGAGHTLTLYTGNGTNVPGKRYWRAGSPRWDNSGDKAILRDSLGRTIDTCQYAGGGTTAYC